MTPSRHILPVHSRRDFLRRAGCGFGGLALAQLLCRDGFAASGAPLPSPLNPLAPRTPHFAPRAKRVIFLFMEGGPSHVDLYDPKPALDKLAGKPMPASFGRVITAMGTSDNTILPSKRKWARHGQSGTWVSDWHPHIARHADDLCVIRSMWADGLNHVGSVCQMNTGSILGGRPSLGSWTTYGLGSVSDNLPSFVIMADGAEPVGGPKNWSSGFLPATYEGTLFRADAKRPILHLDAPDGITDAQQRSKLDLLGALNNHYGADKSDDSALAARLNTYELAFRMQAAAPEAVDLTKETEATKRLYGMDRKETEKFGSMCLLARRLVERGVRFVQLYSGSNSGWDAHSDIEGNHSRLCRGTDLPIAGLLADLKSRGMLDDTLVVWGGEFGRTPFNEKGTGRDHNPWGFTMWLAGGGSRAGTVVGTTDEIGLRAVDDRCHVNDLHATILHLMGMDHLRLTYFHNGRDERATVNGGNVLTKAIA
jgi:hypothetical protein